MDKTPSHKPKGQRVFLFALFFLSLIPWFISPFPEPVCAEGRGPDDAVLLEYRIKAAYIYNFVNFFKWRENVLLQGDIVEVCVLGEDPFSGSLDQITELTDGNHSFRLHYRDRLEDPVDCHVLFISASESSRLGSILQKVRGKSILTVSDIPDFPLKGGIVGFVVRDGRVHLEINTKEARRANLRISAKLLEISTIVE